MRLRESLAEPLRANGADAVHVPEISVSRIDDFVDVAEVRLDPHIGSEPAELLAKRCRLMHVHHDADHLNPHAKIVPGKTSRICTYRRKSDRR